MTARSVLGAGARAGAALAAAQVLPAATWLPAVRLRVSPSLAGIGDPGHLALTFDDGPDPASTPAFLDALDRLGWQATFFVLGTQVRRAPDLLREVAAAGHEIAVHGDRHRYLLARTPRQALDDLRRAHDTVTGVLGGPVGWFRPPYGVLSATGLVAARRLGLRVVLWSAWGRDWRATATPAGVVRDLRHGVLAGGTALLHDSDVTSAPGAWRAALGALPLLAEEATGLGLRVGPLVAHGVPC